MLKKIFLIVIVSFFSTAGFAQKENVPEGWDIVILEGKKGYMNLITGKITHKKPIRAAKKPRVAKELDPTILHKVKKGETLFAIARNYNITVNEIYRLNLKLTPESLKVGQEIVVGYDKTKDGKVVYEEVEDMYTNPSNNSVHYVKAGETLYKIATSNGLSVTRLKELNDLTSNTIKVGQKLLLR